MFTDKDFSKLFNTPNIEFYKIKPFMTDKRLTEPFSICSYNDNNRFDELESYSYELALVLYYNGY